MAECLLPKQNVVGSNPITRSIQAAPSGAAALLYSCCVSALIATLVLHGWLLTVGGRWAAGRLRSEVLHRDPLLAEAVSHLDSCVPLHLTNVLKCGKMG